MAEKLKLTFDVDVEPWLETNIPAIVFYGRTNHGFVKCGVHARVLSQTFHGDGMNPFECLKQNQITIFECLQKIWETSGLDRRGMIMLNNN